MSDNIKVDPGTGGGSPLIGTRTLTVNAVSGVEIPYGILGYENAGTFVAMTGAGLPVSVASLPLPTGAATAANQATANTSLATIASAAGVTAVSNFPSGFLAAQSGSWTVTANAGSGTFAVSASSLPLPTGAATAANQATANTSLATIATAVQAALPAGTNVIGHVIVDAAPTTAVTGTFWQATQPVSLATLPALTAGSAVIGHVVVDTAPTTAVTGTFWQATQPVTQTPATSGGDSIYSVISSGAANQDSAAIKGSAGQVYSYSMFNTTASARYAKFYNKASGATSSDTPVFRIYLPPTGGANEPFPNGLAFGTGICVRLTTGSADNDTGACSTGDVLCNVSYK